MWFQVSNYLITYLKTFTYYWIHWATNFWSCFLYFYFLVFLDVFWCAESENDVSFFVVSAIFL